ncbi:hypothetical protein [Fictibacillus phosphorivorans]|uniref:hypothetical protein n=1 Tax=Fictibacillus phosphorivorans TaxID=1221500 RepID=UPI00129324D0|nr:hypothetical protein [Fictibacillus phosphorivorans]MQR94082.1 hypothetical protein [Fictibacillus phosphorivorans]
MKKIIFFLLLIILISGFVYKLYLNKNLSASLSIEKEAIQQGNFLNDKKAVLYFSTTADQDMDGKGVSLAVFIKDSGEADAFKMKGLELGSVATSQNEVLLVDKNKIRLVGDTYKEFGMDKSQYTGERTGYLEKEKLYFTVFNTGVGAKGGYDSNILYGNKGGFHKENIPHYIAASGIDQSEIVVLTQDNLKEEFHIRKVKLSKNDMTTQDILIINHSKETNFSTMSAILSDETFYYFVGQKTLGEVTETIDTDIVLYRINKNTHAQDEFTISSYRDEKNITAHYPFNIKNSAHLYNDILYYANGLGEVFEFETKTGKVNKTLTMKNVRKDGVRHNEELFYKDDNLYVVRHDAKLKEKYYIEHYSLTRGKKIENIKINGLNDILQSIKGKSIYSYDFKMLK